LSTLKNSSVKEIRSSKNLAEKIDEILYKYAMIVASCERVLDLNDYEEIKRNCKRIAKAQKQTREQILSLL